MKPNRVFLYLGLAFVFLSTGCYGRKLVNVPNTVDQTRIEVEELRRRQDETLRLLQELQSRVDENAVFLHELRADTGSLFAELLDRIQVIEGKADETTHRFSRLSEKVDEVRFSPSVSPDTLQAGDDTLSLGFEEARKAYRDAYLDVNAGNYELARMGFEEFLRNFPDSELSDNAQYWIGECFYAMDEYEEAYGAFKKVLEDYAEGDKVPSALLKAAYCSFALGREDEGRRFLQELISRFPLSEEAHLAEERLESSSM